MLSVESGKLLHKT
jgi:sporulation protein YlmC with PRC-barrel domain